MSEDLTIREGWASLLAEVSSRVDLAATAYESGAFRQGRGVPDAATLLRLCLLYGCGHSLRQVCAWGATSGLARLSNPALTQRLQHTAPWLATIAAALLDIPALGPSATGRRVRLIDASTIAAPGADGTTWRLHLGFDPASGRIERFELTDVHGGERLDRIAPAPGVLDIADAGYGRAGPLRRRLAAGGDVLIRISWRSLRLRDPDRAVPFDLFAALRSMSAQACEWSVAVDDHAPQAAPLRLRLIAARKPLEAQQASRARTRQRAKKKGQRLDPRTLEAADYVVLVTSLPAETFPCDAVLALYRVRWQIELAFKRLKSLLGLGELPARSPAVAQSWLYAKLILALLIDERVAAIRRAFPLSPAHGGAPLAVDGVPLGHAPDRRLPVRRAALAAPA